MIIYEILHYRMKELEMSVIFLLDAWNWWNTETLFYFSGDIW